MDKPRVLVFIDWYTPGYKAGGPVRSLVNLVDHLRDRIDFHIVTSDTDYTEHTPYTGIEADRWISLPGGEKVWYASAGNRSRGVWKELLREQEWSTVYINGIYSWPFSILPLMLAKGRRRVVAVRGMLAEGPMRHGRFKKVAFIRAMKLSGCYRNVEFQATNEEEVRDIRRWIGADAIVHLVPNLPRRADGTLREPREKGPGAVRLVSLGRIAVEKNTLYAIERLRTVTGDVAYDLHGTVYDPDYWERCQRAIAELPANVKVTLKGSVHPDKVPDLFADYHALYMPSQGENFGHSMAEALAAGLPLLISDRTPWRGLADQKAGWDIPLDEHSGYQRSLQLLSDMGQEVYAVWRNGALALGARYLGDRTTSEKTYALFTR